MKLVQYTEYLVMTVDTGDFVLFNNVCKLSTKKTQLRITGPLRGEFTDDR